MVGAGPVFGRWRWARPQWVGQPTRLGQSWPGLPFERPRFHLAPPRLCDLSRSGRLLPLPPVCYQPCSPDIFPSETRKLTRNKETNPVLQRQRYRLILLRTSLVPLNCSAVAERRIERTLLDGKPAKPRLALERYSLRRRYIGLCRIAPNRRMQPSSPAKALPDRPHAHNTGRCDPFAGVLMNLPLRAERFLSKAQAAEGVFRPSWR